MIFCSSRLIIKCIHHEFSAPRPWRGPIGIVLVCFAKMSHHQARSKRSRFMTLSHTATKSCRNFSCESPLA